MLLIIVCVVLSILIFVSKKDIRKAFLAVLTAQLFTWPLGLLLTFLGKVEYPVRLFPKAIESSFLNDSILYPTVFAIYYIHYPKQAKLIRRWLYTLLITAIPIFIEVLESKYTNIIKYKNWNVYYNWMLGIVLYFIMRKYINWFLKNVSKQGVSRNEA